MIEVLPRPAASTTLEAVTPGPRSARTKIIRLLVVTLVTLTVLIGVSAVGLGLLHHRVTVLADRYTPEMAANTGVRVAMLDAQAAVRGYLSTGEDEFLDGYRTSLPRIDASLAELHTLAADDPAIAATAAEQDRLARAWLDGYAAPMAAGTIRAGDAASLEAARLSFDEFRVANDQAAADLKARTDALVDQSRWLTEAAIATILLVGVGGKALVIRPGLRALRFIGPPLEALHQTVRALRSGDRSARADATEGVVEIRAVAAAVNELADTNERQREYLAQQLRLAEAVRQVGLVIGRSLDLERVIDQAAEVVSRRFRASTVWLRTFEGQGEAPGRGLGSSYPSESTLDIPDGVYGLTRRIAYLAHRRQRCVAISPHHPRDPELLSAAEHELLLRLAAEHGERCLLLVPVGAGPECLGYLTAGRTPDQPEWTSPELEALLQVGRDIGRAVLHARLFGREQELVGELQDLDIKKRDFVSMVSHELRTPLAAIIGHLEIVRSGDLGPVPADMEPSLVAMDRNSTRLTRLIEDLLLISRIEEGVQPTRLHPLDLGRLAREAAELHHEAATTHGVRLEVAVDGPAPVLGDSDELERVIGNLLSNAIKYSPHGGAVVVQVRSDARRSVVRVSDQGLGISPADQQQLFTRFFRSSNPAALAVPGTGLGLTISKLIVEKHRGTIMVRSVEGAGSTFEVTLPAAAAERTVGSAGVSLG